MQGLFSSTGFRSQFPDTLTFSTMPNHRSSAAPVRISKSCPKLQSSGFSDRNLFALNQRSAAAAASLPSKQSVGCTSSMSQPMALDSATLCPTVTTRVGSEFHASILAESEQNGSSMRSCWLPAESSLLQASRRGRPTRRAREEQEIHDQLDCFEV